MQLNEMQQKAVDHTEGPVLIVAGAGAGKTKTITERVVAIVRKGTDPRAILAITFTNKAAKEMRERIVSRLIEEHLIDEGAHHYTLPTIKTFHSLGVMILSRWHEKLGLPKHLTILDQSDSGSIVKQTVLSLGLDPKLHDPTKIRNIISREKGDFVSVESYEKKVASAQMEIVAKVWRRYEEELRSQRAVDFDDLIIKTVTLLETNPEIREFYHSYFKYVHVDEYQDTNEAQYSLTQLLVDPKTHNICVVGDTDQNIYSWRGANLQNLLSFEKDFPGTTTVVLEENYRSTSHILSLANVAIKKNTVRKEKNLFTRSEGGEPITVQPCFDENSEAVWIAKKAKERMLSGVRGENIAVLYRANFQSRILEEAFLNEGVSYTLLGTHFFDRKEVKDIMAYLRAANNRDSLQDLKRVFETPKKGLGKATLLKIFAGEPIPGSAAIKVNAVYSFLDTIIDTLSKNPLSHVIHMIIVDSGIEKELLEGSSDDKERLENIRELVSLTLKYDGMPGEEALPIFLEEASLQSDQDNDTPEHSGVRLMTIHASKGLEFDVVFISGLEHDLFPHTRLGERKQSKEQEEEERRLFYVAVTRARKKLYMSYAELRTIFGQKQINAPSEFLRDVEEVEHEWHDVYYEAKRPFTVYL